MSLLKICLVIVVFLITFFVTSVIGVQLFCNATGVKLGQVSDSDEWSEYGIAVTFAVLGVSIYITKMVYELLLAL